MNHKLMELRSFRINYFLASVLLIGGILTCHKSANAQLNPGAVNVEFRNPRNNRVLRNFTESNAVGDVAKMKALEDCWQWAIKTDRNPCACKIHGASAFAAVGGVKNFEGLLTKFLQETDGKLKDKVLTCSAQYES